MKITKSIIFRQSLIACWLMLAVLVFGQLSITHAADPIPTFWVGADNCGGNNNVFSLSGSDVTMRNVNGDTLIYSNGDVKIYGSGNSVILDGDVILADAEDIFSYTGIDLVNSNFDIVQPPEDVVIKQTEPPIDLTLDDFRDTGFIGSQADLYYEVIPGEINPITGNPWVINGGAWKPNYFAMEGLFVVDGYEVAIGNSATYTDNGLDANSVFDGVTIVSSGYISFKGADISPYILDTLAFTTVGDGSCYENRGIAFTGSSNVVAGHFFAPNGEISFSNSNGATKSCFVASSINLSGSNQLIVCDSSDFLMQLPRTIILGDDITLTDIDNILHGNNGLPSINVPIIIEGNGFTIERSAGVSDTFRLFHVGTSGSLELNDVTLQNGNETDNGGGAIYNRGLLAVNNSQIRGNESIGGGGIFSEGLAVTLNNTILSGNSGGDGGAFYNEIGSATLTNSTIAGNNATGFGGGILNNGIMNVNNSVVWGNSASTDAQIGNNNILSLNHSGVEDVSAVIYANDGGNLDLSGGANIFVAHETASNAPTITGDYHLNAVVTNPLINVGDNSLIASGIATDFEGDDRIIGGTVDMGADESDILLTCGDIAFPYMATSSIELRTAVECANLTPITDTITLGNDIILTEIDNMTDGNNGLPSIVSPIIIGGQGHTLSRSNAISDTFRIFHVATSGTLNLYNITLSNGSAQDTDPNIFEDEEGGAIYNLGKLFIKNSDIQNNEASSGGGISNYYNGLNDNTLRIEDTIISNNLATNGGGIHNSSALSSPLVIVDSRIENNIASNQGGGIGSYGPFSLTNSFLQGNQAEYSAGFVVEGGETIILNSVISGNHAITSAGAFYSVDPSASNTRVRVINSVVVSNLAENIGGFSNSGTVDLENSIVWGNVAISNPQIHNTGTVNASFSGIEDGLSLNGTVNDNGGNINLSSGDNVFVAPEPASNAPTTAGDYHLVNNSLVINSGDNSLIPVGITTDFEGDDRIIDGTVDMGADEVLEPCIATAATRGELIVAINTGNVRDCGANPFTILLTDDITFSIRHNSQLGKNALPVIVADMIIEGDNHTLSRTVNDCPDSDATKNFRFFLIENSSHLTLRDLTLENGCLSGLEYSGGAISVSDGQLTLENVIANDNQARDGGAINFGTNSSIATQGTIKNSQITNNVASGWGGGLRINALAQVEIFETTISGNDADFGGGLINGTQAYVRLDRVTLSGNSGHEGGGLSNSGIVSLFNSTVSNNYSPGVGGGLYHVLGNNASKINVYNTTIAENYAVNGGNAIYLYKGTVNLKNSIAVGGTNIAGDTCEGLFGRMIVDLGNNVFDDTSCNGVASSSIYLGSLADNGGSTLTHALLPASSAIDAGDPAPCANPSVINNLDQRGVIRPFDGDGIGGAICDIGAYEFNGTSIPLDTNLIYNPSFNLGANGEAGWRTNGSLVSTVTAGVLNLNFPTSISGWFHQFRAAYSLPPGLKMVAWVNVSNPDPVTKTFQFVMRDSDMSNTYLCAFTVPPNAPARNYWMRFITATNWEIIRADMRPTVVDSGGLNFDDVNLRYRPWLTFTAKECIPPTFSDEAPAPPPETELVENSVGVAFNATSTCESLDWFNTDNWVGYLSTSEVQFVFDPFPQNPPSVYGGIEGGNIFDANGDGVADTLYDALSYNGHGRAVSLLREAVIAMLNDRYDSNHPEAWWAVEIDTAEALAQGENAMLALAQQYALSNASCH